MIRINEIFDSWEGEGRDTGIPTTFVRLQGCEVHCKWCDTPESWDLGGGTEQSIERIVRQCWQNRVSITGGEPLLQIDEVKKLVTKLGVREIALETSGLYDFSEFPDRVRIVADLKTPSSGVRMIYDYIRDLSERDDLIAVCKTAEDVAFAKRHFSLLRNEGCFACYFFSVEQGNGGIVNLLKDFRDDYYRIQIQLHKILRFK